jgi:hypothetical protein
VDAMTETYESGHSAKLSGATMQIMARFSTLSYTTHTLYNKKSKRPHKCGRDECGWARGLVYLVCKIVYRAFKNKWPNFVPSCNRHISSRFCPLLTCKSDLKSSEPDLAE